MYHSEFVRAVAIAYTKMKSLRKVAAMFELGLSTIKRWKANEWCRIRSPKSHVPPQVIEFIQGIIAHNPFYSCTTISQRVHEVFGMRISRQLMAIVLKRYRISKVRSRLAVPEQCIEKQNMQLRTFVHDIAQLGGRPIVAIDESGVDERTRPVMGYVQQGQRLYAPRQTGSWSHVSVVMAITQDGVLGHNLHYGAINTERFALFVEGLHLPQNAVVLMDNINFHKSSQVVKRLRARGIDILYTPCYFSDANPIENIFGVLKSLYRSIPPLEPVIERMDEAIASLYLAPEEMFKSCFARSVRLAVDRIQLVDA
jgi:transposase